MRTIPWLALALCLCGLAGQALTQQAAKGPPPKPIVLYGNFRELMNEGKFDVAANFLQTFLDVSPTDADLLEIEKKYGTTVFLGLRTVPKWSDDPTADKKARANVEELIKRAKAASEKLLHDPARVAKYVRNLGATFEERVYAEQELRRTGDFAIPYMVEELRVTRDKDLYAGLLGAIKHLEGTTIPGWVAALDGLTPDQQYGVVSAITSRPDVLNLQTFAQSDLTPYLWRIMAQPRDQNPTLRTLAEALLNSLTPGRKADTKLPEAELTTIARTFYDHTARYAGARNNADGTPITVPLWVWDAKTEKLTKIEEVPIGQVEEYYGLRYARWVLERKSDYEPAQGLVLSLAAERAIERAKFGNLARAEPGVFKLLSDAPSVVLADLLNRGLNQKRTALVLAMLQVLGDRADRNVATPPAGLPTKPSLLVKALGYPDPQVQFAAANALLRSPVPLPSAVRGQIVDVLRRAAGADTGTPPKTAGTALLVDPNRSRSDATAILLRGLGYEVEVFTTGRDLLRRIGRASDFDVIFIDHHTPNPELIDVVGQLQADVKAGNRPTFVVASPDKSRLPTFDQLLIRFSALIAATENDAAPLPPPLVPDPRDTPEETASKRKANREQRDGVFRRTAATRVARLNRVLDATGVQLTETQKLLLALRIELMAYSILAAEFPLSVDSAPETVALIGRIRKQLAAQPSSPPYGAGTPTIDLLKLMERFEIDLARVPGAQKRFEELYARVDPTDLGLTVETFRDPVIEARLGRTLRNYPAIRIIPEPYGRASLEIDLKASYADPAQAPRDPAEKQAAQKLAVEWLRRMATGDLPGFEVKSAEPELRAALRVDDLADAAVDAVARFGSAEAQQDLLSLAITPGRPLLVRSKAADAVIRHVQLNGKLIPKTLLEPLSALSGTEPDLALRGKLLTLKGMLAYNPGEFVNQLKGYNPPLLPPPPAKEPPKAP